MNTTEFSAEQTSDIAILLESDVIVGGEKLDELQKPDSSPVSYLSDSLALDAVDGEQKYDAAVKTMETEATDYCPIESTVGSISTVPVNLADILSETSSFLKKYIVFSNKHQPLVIAAWSAMTYFTDTFEYSPYLYINSATKRSGKSRVLDCMEMLVRDPFSTVSPSDAVLFRKIERDCPTFFIDEVDAIFGKRKDDSKETFRSLLNAGFKRGALIPRCFGSELKEFSVFCPKILAGIGKLPDTVADRSIPIRLVRKSPNEEIERFRERDARLETEQIRKDFEELAKNPAMLEALKNARPQIPKQLNDRQADICEPLLAIVDVAGGEWPSLLRQALVVLCCSEEAEDDEVSIRLLRDIRRVFEEAQVDRLSSVDLLNGLVALESDSPCAEWWEQNLSENNTKGPASKLARLLKPFEIVSATIRVNGSTLKGFHKAAFADAWRRYLPETTSEDVTTSQCP